jgi:hypothetical protein
MPTPKTLAPTHVSTRVLLSAPGRLKTIPQFSLVRDADRSGSKDAAEGSLSNSSDGLRPLSFCHSFFVFANAGTGGARRHFHRGNTQHEKFWPPVTIKVNLWLALFVSRTTLEESGDVDVDSQLSFSCQRTAQ